MFREQLEPVVAQALRESHVYGCEKPRTIPPADSPNRPALELLFNVALSERAKRPNAKRFVYEGVRYSIVWAGSRMCVLHVPSARIIVGAPGPRSE